MKNHHNNSLHNRGIQIVKVTIISCITSSFLTANSCSGGACGVTIPNIPNDIQMKPFNASNTQEIKESYNAWALVDNGGDTAIGENRFMAGTDIYSLYKDGDTLSLFGLITDESLINGKISYAYPILSKRFLIEGSYSQTNYILDIAFPDATGIGTMNTLEGKIIYPAIRSNTKKLNLAISFNNNNINDEITNESVVTNSGKSSYEASAYIDLEAENYPLFTLPTSHKFYLGISAGYLSFDNKDNERLDELTYKTKGSYTKVNLEYKNIITLSEKTSLESNFRSQYALNNKNLDDSESFTIGGINGVKTYEQNSVYSSNGIFASIEAKYKLPALGALNNSVGTFYDYGKIWESDSIFSTSEDISVQDIGIGFYTHYKAFFSKAQVAFELGDSDIATKDDENYRVILQAGFIF